MKWFKKAALALAAIVILPAGLKAQGMEPGKWTGSALIDGTEVPLSFDVTVKDGAIGIMVDAGQHGQFKFEDVKLDGNKLTWWFTPGPKVSCSLEKKESGNFEGNCVGDDGMAVPFKMMPPKKGW